MPDSQNPQPQAPQGFVVNLVGRPAFWVVFTGLILTLAIVRATWSGVPDPPPILLDVPEFALVDQNDESFGSDDLRGKLWVANFIFTRCTTICPVFTEKMGTIQHRVKQLQPHMKLVSFSVDPEYDTPAILAEYAYQHRASPRLWHFLTGDNAAVQSIVVEGLKTTLQQDEDSTNPDGILHGSHFVLVDHLMRIRGFYDVNDEDSVRRMMSDIQMILLELNRDATALSAR